MLYPKIRSASFIPVLALAAILAGCAVQPAPTDEAVTVVAPPPPGERANYQIFFDTDSAELGADARAVIASIAAFSAKNMDLSVRVIGKTDRVGAPPVNMALSKRRTEAVLAALIGAGMPTARIDWGWTGERNLPVPTADGKAEARNRVVEVSVAKEVD